MKVISVLLSVKFGSKETLVCKVRADGFTCDGYDSCLKFSGFDFCYDFIRCAKGHEF